ncbi:MAG: DUF6361 family protein [Myxococcota bacterium]
MRSLLAWLDHDTEAHERSQRMLALFDEKDARDELGLGGIRDAFSDLFFPGTSTIQTRVRYMFFVPWVYQLLETQGVSSSDAAKRARDLELRLTPALKAGCDDDEWGIFGVSAGRTLKRLPSMAYWSGLAEWGIRRYGGSRGQYHAGLDVILEGRRLTKGRKERALDHGDDSDTVDALRYETWHPKLPKAPQGFPDEPLDFRLTREEATFLRDRIIENCADSLLARLLQLEQVDEAANAPWEIGRAKLSDNQQSNLELARLFSLVVHGAAFLYNLELARELRNDQWIARYEGKLSDWGAEITRELDTIRAWAGDLGPLWTTVMGRGYRITPATRSFVERWAQLAVGHRGEVQDHPQARRLVRQRERQMKGTRSRFDNRRARENWGGAAGVARLRFRWDIGKLYVREICDGLRRSE